MRISRIGLGGNVEGGAVAIEREVNWMRRGKEGKEGEAVVRRVRRVGKVGNVGKVKMVKG